jgi:hypothetical protein
VLDFGEVCVKSVSVKSLDFLNTLDRPIHVELEVYCNINWINSIFLKFFLKNDSNDLRQTSPLTQITQPQSKSSFTVVFESDYVQTFQRTISYTINYSYRHHVIILAKNKLQSLKLSTNHVVLTQLSFLCYRSNISVINRLTQLPSSHGYQFMANRTLLFQSGPHLEQSSRLKNIGMRNSMAWLIFSSAKRHLSTSSYWRWIDNFDLRG